MGSAHSPRWGEPILSRHADVEFGSCRGIQPLAAMTKSLADPAARSLVVFSHGINGPTGTRLENAPNILSSSCHAYGSTAVDRFLFVGCFQSRVSKELIKLCGASLQAL